MCSVIGLTYAGFQTANDCSVSPASVAEYRNYSGPDVGFPRGDARLDFTDLYAFPKPRDARKSILIMNVHPSSSVQPPGLTTTEPFVPEALYELKIDTDGDAVADIAYRVRFFAFGGGQTATLRRVEGAEASGDGDGGQVIVEKAPVSMARVTRPATIASSRAGEAILSSSTYTAQSTICSSPAMISLLTKIFAAAPSSCPTQPWGLNRFGCGPARW